MSAIDDLMAAVDATNKANPVRQVTHLSDPPRLVPAGQTWFENSGGVPAIVEFNGERHTVSPGQRLLIPSGLEPLAFAVDSHGRQAVLFWPFPPVADTPQIV